MEVSDTRKADERFKTVRDLRFVVMGSAPSKENFRMNSKTGRKAWARIKAFEEQVGQAALVARQSLGKHRKAFLDAPVSITIEMHQQRIDLDNSKLIIDALKNVIIRDDDQRHVRQVSIRVVDDGVATLYGGPHIAVTVQMLPQTET